MPVPAIARLALIGSRFGSTPQTPRFGAAGVAVSATVDSRHFEQALLAMAREFGPQNAVNSLRAPIRAALGPVLEDLRSRTPVDSGRLRDSARLTIGRPPRPNGSPLDVGRTTNSIIQGRVGYNVSGRNGRGLRARAIAQEFGTINQTARPVLQPSFDRRRNRILGTFCSQLDSSIQRQARSLARRQRRGTLRRR